MRSYLPRLLRRTSGIARRYRYVFVVTYGRSGSTLLMGILNTIPGYRVRGENFNALYRLYQADAAVQRGQRERGRDGWEPKDPWYGVFAWRPKEFRAALLDTFVANVLAPAPGDRVLGFKEIRYTDFHIKDLEDYLRFLVTAFPNAKIIFNHRTVADVAKSGWWARTSNAAARITAADERMRAIAPDDQHFHFSYDEIDDSLDNIRELFRFLDEELDERRVREALATRHSYTKAPPGNGPVPGDQAAGRTLIRRLRTAARVATRGLR